MRTFVMGDLHGNYRGFLQCLQRSGFNKEEDTLIQLGDVADGWSETFECVQELLEIKNLIAIRGNHDDWTNTWMNTGTHPGMTQGGRATVDSYLRVCDFAENYMEKTYISVPKEHKDFFTNQINHYVDKENRLFVHAGINRHFPINDKIHNSSQVLNWDRDFWLAALSHKNSKEQFQSSYVGKFKIHDNFKEVFIGHTATVNWNKITPMYAANVINMDTGSGFKGKLTIMNVDTKEYWQSDLVTLLYPNEKGR